MSLPLSGSECRLRIAGDQAEDAFLPIEGVRLSGWKVSQEAVEVTDAGDAGWRRLLSGAGHRSLELQLSGLYLASPGERRLREMAFTGEAFRCELTLDGGSALQGRFIASELSFEGAINEEATYSATLLSSGLITIN